MDKTHFPPLSHTETRGDSEQGHVCVCSGVKFYPTFIFFYENKLSRKHTLEKVREAASDVNMLSEPSSRWRIDEHLSHGLLKQEVCLRGGHLQWDFIVCGQH